MPARPIWRGHLRLALVSCPVALWNAKHERNTIRFNQINPKTGHRIRMMTVDAETDEEVQRRDLVKRRRHGMGLQRQHDIVLDAQFLRLRDSPDRGNGFMAVLDQAKPVCPDRVEMGAARHDRKIDPAGHGKLGR